MSSSVSIISQSSGPSSTSSFTPESIQTQLLKRVLQPLFDGKILLATDFHLPIKDFGFLLALDTFDRHYNTPSLQDYEQFMILIEQLASQSLTLQKLSSFEPFKDTPVYKALNMIGKCGIKELLEKPASFFLSEPMGAQEPDSHNESHIARYNTLIDSHYEKWGAYFCEALKKSMIDIEKLNLGSSFVSTDDVFRTLNESVRDFFDSAKIMLTTGERRPFCSTLASRLKRSKSTLHLWSDRLKFLRICTQVETKTIFGMFDEFTFALSMGAMMCRGKDDTLANIFQKILGEIQKGNKTSKDACSMIVRLLQLAHTHEELTFQSVRETDYEESFTSISFPTPKDHVPFIGKKKKSGSSSSRTSKPLPPSKKASPTPPAPKEKTEHPLPQTTQATAFQVMDETLFRLANEVEAADEDLQVTAQNSFKNTAYHLQALREGIAAYEHLTTKGPFHLIPAVVSQLTFHEHHLLECLVTARMAARAKSYDDLELTHHLSELLANDTLGKGLDLGNIWVRYPNYYQWLNQEKGSSPERLSLLLNTSESHAPLLGSLQTTLKAIFEDLGEQEDAVFPNLEHTFEKASEPSSALTPLEKKIVAGSKAKVPGISGHDKMIMDLAYKDVLYHLRQLELTRDLIEQFPEYATLTTSSAVMHTQFLLEQYNVIQCIRAGHGVVRTSHNLESYAKIITSIPLNLVRDLNVGTMVSYIDWETANSQNLPFAQQALNNSFALGREFRRVDEQAPRISFARHNELLQEFIEMFLSELTKLK